MASARNNPTTTTQPTRAQMEDSNRQVEEAARREPRAELPTGFTRISTDRVLYKAGESATALRGEIIGVERVKEDGWKKDWKAMDVMIIRLKQDAEWDLLDAKGQVSEHVVALADDDVMVVLQAGLRKIASLDDFGELKMGLVKQAFAIGKSPEVFIQPTEKVQIRNGNNLWKWTVGCSAPTQWRSLAEVAPDQMGVGFDKELAAAVQAGALGSAAGGARQLPAAPTNAPALPAQGDAQTSRAASSQA